MGPGANRQGFVERGPALCDPIPSTGRDVAAGVTGRRSIHLIGSLETIQARDLDDERPVWEGGKLRGQLSRETTSGGVGWAGPSMISASERARPPGEAPGPDAAPPGRGGAATRALAAVVTLPTVRSACAFVRVGSPSAVAAQTHTTATHARPRVNSSPLEERQRLAKRSRLPCFLGPLYYRMS